jgi:hypothetical protein
MQNVYYTVHLAMRIVHCAFFIMRFAFLRQAFFGFGYEKLSEYLKTNNVLRMKNSRNI